MLIPCVSNLLTKHRKITEKLCSFIELYPADILFAYNLSVDKFQGCFRIKLLRQLNTKLLLQLKFGKLLFAKLIYWPGLGGNPIKDI